MVMSIVKLLDTSGKNWILAERIGETSFALVNLPKRDYESEYTSNTKNSENHTKNITQERKNAQE